MEENFVVVLVAGLAVFGVLFVASEGINFQETPEEMVFIKKSPGKIGDANQDFHTVNFGSFTVGEGRGDIQVYTREKKTLENKLIGGQKISFEYNATAPKHGHISFEVLGKDGNGAVYAKVNGEKVFQEKLVVTGTPEINISQDRFHPGMNTIEVGTTRGGLLGSTKYVVEDVEITVNDRKFHDYRDNFQLAEPWVRNFVNANLTFTIPLDASTATKPLRIYVNDHRVFSQKVVRSTQEVRITKQNAELHPGMNTIRFETDGNARYELENADMSVRYIGTVSPGHVSFDFKLNQSELDYAKREDTSEYINFEYLNLLPTNSKMIIELNEFHLERKPDPGFNSISVPAENIQEQNSLTLKSNGSYELTNVKLLSEMVEN
ncbi:MAG: hypothetical protein ABEJ69_00985 [Candidatus Nanohaloarchaea archaeon]